MINQFIIFVLKRLPYIVRTIDVYQNDDYEITSVDFLIRLRKSGKLVHMEFDFDAICIMDWNRLVNRYIRKLKCQDKFND